MNKEFKLGELFCGPGGIGIGSKNLSVQKNGIKYQIKHAWATDYHKDSCKTYAKNIFPNNLDRVICEDIRELNFDRLKKISDIDALTFGFPCNDFSLVGEQKGINGKFGPLYSYCTSALEYFQPKWFIAENVGGLKSSNNGAAFKLIMKSFKKSGYNLFPHLYKFQNYGVPQNRHRIIIVGIRLDLGLNFKIPKPLDYLIPVKKALENIPADIMNHEPTKQSSRVIERLKHIMPGQNAFTADLPEDLRLNVKGAKISQIYKRLKPDQPSYTVTGSGGGGTHVYHWKENRALTNRERARIQTFPDDFIFEGGKESVRKQIGMAVPPEGIRHIFLAILKTFADIEYEYIPSSMNIAD